MSNLMSWIDFRSQYKGSGLSRQEISSMWQQYKDENGIKTKSGRKNKQFDGIQENSNINELNRQFNDIDLEETPNGVDEFRRTPHGFEEFRRTPHGFEEREFEENPNGFEEGEYEENEYFIPAPKKPSTEAHYPLITSDPNMGTQYANESSDKILEVLGASNCTQLNVGIIEDGNNNKVTADSINGLWNYYRTTDPLSLELYPDVSHFEKLSEVDIPKYQNYLSQIHDVLDDFLESQNGRLIFYLPDKTKLVAYIKVGDKISGLVSNINKEGIEKINQIFSQLPPYLQGENISVVTLEECPSRPSNNINQYDGVTYHQGTGQTTNHNIYDRYVGDLPSQMNSDMNMPTNKGGSCIIV